MSNKRPYSSIVVDGVEQAPSRAMLYPVGFSEADFKKPQIGIASTWSRVTPCNMHIDELAATLNRGQRIIIIENNQSGQFAYHLRAESGIVAHGHIRKYDGEPFEPKHIVASVKDVIGGQEVVEVISTEPGWRTGHPTGTSGTWSGLKVTKPSVPVKN